MDLFLSAAWLVCGAVVGAMLAIALGPMRAKKQAQQAKLALADGQQRRALERMRESHHELTEQIESLNRRNAQQIEALKHQHGIELRAAEDEIRRVREQVSRLLDVAEEGQVISGTSFQPTQFDESEPPAPPKR